MKDFKIYTCGKMNGLTLSQQMIWRKDIEYYIRSGYEDIHGRNSNITVINPPDYFNYDDASHKTEKEIFEWELGQVCSSDVVIVNLDGISDSIGSHMEIGAVLGACISSGRNIKIVAIGEIPQNIHPWIELSWFRHEKDLKDAAKYIVDYLLV